MQPIMESLFSSSFRRLEVQLCTDSHALSEWRFSDQHRGGSLERLEQTQKMQSLEIQAKSKLSTKR